jgi:hypothetical protein
MWSAVRLRGKTVSLHRKRSKTFLTRITKWTTLARRDISLESTWGEKYVSEVGLVEPDVVAPRNRTVKYIQAYKRKTYVKITASLSPPTWFPASPICMKSCWLQYSTKQKRLACFGLNIGWRWLIINQTDDIVLQYHDSFLEYFKQAYRNPLLNVL